MTELDVRAAACRSGVPVAGPTRRAQTAPRTTTAHAAGAERQTIAADGGRSYRALVGGTHEEARPRG